LLYIKLSQSKLDELAVQKRSRGRKKKNVRRHLLKLKKNELRQSKGRRAGGKNKPYLKKGEELFNNASFKEAIESFKQALEVDPKNKEALSYIKLSQSKLAELALQEKKQREEELRQKALADKKERLERQKAQEEEKRKAALAKAEEERAAAKQKEEELAAKIGPYLKKGEEYLITRTSKRR